MTSRQRVQRVLAGETVDRIPNALGGCETAGMHVLAYDKLKQILGVSDTADRIYTFMTNAVFELSVLNAMDGDVIILNSRMCPSRLWGNDVVSEWKGQMLWGKQFQVPNAWQFHTETDGTIWWDGHRKCPPGGVYFDGIPGPSDLPDMSNQPSPRDYRPSHELSQEYLRKLEDSAQWLYQNTDYSIACGETIQDLQLKPGGLHAWWMRMVMEPDACHEFLARAVEASLSQLKQLDQAVGKYCDTLMIADDIGDVRGVTCGPDLWRGIYKPHYSRWWTEWHQITDMKVSFHSCGSLVDILPDLVECGLDILNPVQISAEGMQPEAIREAAGPDLIFYGGALDAVITPPGTSEEAVYARARDTIITLAKGGRYLFAGTHNIPGDTPESHIRAMLRAYWDCRDRESGSALSASEGVE